MPPKQSKPLVPMVTRSRAKAKKNAEPQTPVHAKRSRKDMSPMPEEVRAEDDVLNVGCASRDGGSGKAPAETHIRPVKDSKKLQKENCKPKAEINIEIPSNIEILNVEINEPYQENATVAEFEQFDALDENELNEPIGLTNDGQEEFTIHNAIELLNINYDNWKSHFTGTSSDDDSIKAFISYENLHYPDNIADLANKCGTDVVTLINAFENGLDITHEIISHVSDSSDENSVHTDQTSLKKKPDLMKLKMREINAYQTNVNVIMHS
ncbi:hypothetical protein Ddc_13539 [Ditylenchus destructor]|nr:hypothetical protein Ddc_13539 [Ditylenchus destructor]